MGACKILRVPGASKRIGSRPAMRRWKNRPSSRGFPKCSDISARRADSGGRGWGKPSERGESPQMDVFSAKKRSEVMAAVGSRNNQTTELALMQA
jgi:hypothetical protein